MPLRADRQCCRHGPSWKALNMVEAWLAVLLAVRCECCLLRSGYGRVVDWICRHGMKFFMSRVLRPLLSRVDCDSA